MKDDRNPLLLPDAPARPARRACPKCGGENFIGDNLGGVILWTCRIPTCRNQWQGGLPQMPEDPTVPRPPVDPKDQPTIRFMKDPKSPTGVSEIRNRPSTVQEFRKGLPIPQGEE